MAKEQGYNGWYNYETWKMNLEFFDGMSGEDIAGAEYWMDTDTLDAYDLGERMKEMVEDYVYMEVQNSMLRGWLDVFISEVNFTEIAQRKIEEYQ